LPAFFAFGIDLRAVVLGEPQDIYDAYDAYDA
jgi:hypothetical protein